MMFRSNFMITKALEIRDRGTFIPVIATLMTPAVDDGRYEQESYLLARSGYGRDPMEHPLIMLCRMDANGGSSHQASYDAYGWGGARTLTVAQQYILEHFEELHSGDVIDVEFILGESAEAKRSEACEPF